MRNTRRRLLKTTGVALGGVGLAGCGGQSGTDADEPTPTDTATATATAEPTATETPMAEASAATALAAEWNVMRARLHDAMALGQAEQHGAAAAF